MRLSILPIAICLITGCEVSDVKDHIPVDAIDTGLDDTDGTETGLSAIDDDGDGQTEDEGDCDDANPSAYSGGTEACDGVDNDCDGAIDPDTSVGALIWYADADADGYGDDANGVTACDQPSGYVFEAADCDDADSRYHPGADESDCTDPNDYNCDGSAAYSDADADGYPACEDCNDGDPAVSPSATEVCNGVDDDCDEILDIGASDEAIWYADDDADGYGGTFSTLSCEQPSGYVATADDCDDADDTAYPGATETCDGADDDCDTLVDEDAVDAEIWYADADGDTHGDGSSSVAECAAPAAYVATSDDCDDTSDATGPGALEICDEADNDCDGMVDLGAIDALTWYADADGDAFGDGGSSSDACSQPSGSVADATDCDDGDAAVNPDAAEVWYDGVDQDCDGASDDDADGDGDDSDAHGGTDCDDADATRYGGTRCRPDPTCTHPSSTTLTAHDPSGVSDLAFDADCVAWTSTLINGTDYVYSIDAAGANTVLTGASNHDIGSLALHPVTGNVAVSYNNVGYLGVQSGTSLAVVATGGLATGSNWSNVYLNQSASSIAMDSAGCIWVPNWNTSGTVDCVVTAGTYTTAATLSAYVESVALDAEETLYASVGATVWAIDPTAGATTTLYTFPATVLDMVFDYQGDLYVETTGDELRLLEEGASSDSSFTTVSGDGKLAISPDGYLVRVRTNPVSVASYEEWALGD